MQNLDNRTPITNPDGSPTEYFMRLLQGRGGLLEDTGDQIDRLDAEVSALLARQIIAGDGLDGGGPLSSNVTLTADVQEILDQITVTQGYVLYRAAGGWAALPPGTTGQVLQTNGAGADPSWATSAGGDIQVMLDTISSAQGTVLYRGAAAWAALAPGTAGQFLKTNGAGADPAWANAAGGDIQAMLDSISSTRGTVLYRGAAGWAPLAPGTSGHFLKTNGAGADPAWAAQAAAPDIQSLLNGISTTQGAVLYRNATDWVALAPGTAGQFLKTNGAGFNPAWGTPSGSGGGGIYVRPSVVQYASSCANSGSVTFAAPVTPGNLLICVASHYNNVTNFTSGWSILLNRNGASTDGNLVATKIADSGDSTVISIFGDVSGSNMTIFEVQDSLGVVVLPWRDIQEQAGSSTTTLRVGIPNDKCLLVGAFSTVSANTAPTSVTGATAGTTVTGTSASASPRQITPYVNNTVTKGSQTVTATYAATPRSYGYAVVALPSI